MQHPSFHEYLGDGISAIDTGLERPHFAACFLIEGDGEAALFDAGTSHSVERILATLAARKIDRSALRWLIASHVHLDHAGGVGALLRELPNATVLAHPRGVPHLVDPSVLQASAEGVYGVDVVAEAYGALVPVPASRIRALADGEIVDLGGRRLQFMDSPGHARHHVTLFDAASASWFTGDCFGISYREFDGGSAPFIFPTSSPVQFDPPALKTTITRMLARAPRAMMLTHYSRLEDPAARGEALLRLLDAQVALARAHADAPDALATLIEALHGLFLDEVRRLGSPVGADETRRLLAIDVELNAKGMLIWLAHAARRR